MAFALLGEEEEAYEELQNEVPNLIVEELEKIKAEIIENHKCNSDYNDYSMGMKTQERIDIKIIEKRISELKGE